MSLERHGSLGRAHLPGCPGSGANDRAVPFMDAVEIADGNRGADGIRRNVLPSPDQAHD